MSKMALSLPRNKKAAPPNGKENSLCPKPGLQNNLFIFGLLFLPIALILLSGCPQESQSQLFDEQGGEYGSFSPASSETAIGFMVQEWRLFSILFMLISIGLVALAYPLANALSMPDLRAWADVELGEAFSTAIIIMVVIASLIFVEVVAHGLILGSQDFDCGESSKFCPVTVAEQYLEGYLDKSMAIYRDLFKNAMLSGKLATMSFVLGTNYLFAGYLSISFKLFPHFMIEVTTITQQMQFLTGMRDALIFQQFILNHVSSTLAPMALLLGIIFRSFFITRKLGGLLMAFGIGFLLVFPASYALAMYTLQTTLYGATTTGGQVTNDFCTAACMELPPAAYNGSSGIPYGATKVRELFPQGEGSGISEDETYEEYKNRINFFLKGKECELVTITVPDQEDPLVQVEKEVWSCTPITGKTSPVTNEYVYTCGYYDEICPQMCRSLPYPNQIPDCASRFNEYNCRNNVPEECFIIRYADVEDPMLQGLEPADMDECPEDCRPVVGMKKEGCDVGYGFVYTGDEMKVGDINEQMDEAGYGGESVIERCEEIYPTMAEFLCNDGRKASTALTILGFKNLKEGGTVAWELGCPNHCRWISTSGKKGIGCDALCSAYPFSPAALWAQAYAFWEADNLGGQIQIAESTCYNIIPDKVFTSNECSACNYLIDPGFASYPPIHMKCANICGKAKSVSVEKSDSGSGVDGFKGPAEMKSVTKLVVPAIVLPMLNLVITFIFIRALSPILGGDVDIPGMMGMIR